MAIIWEDKTKLASAVTPSKNIVWNTTPKTSNFKVTETPKKVTMPTPVVNTKPIGLLSWATLKQFPSALGDTIKKITSTIGQMYQETPLFGVQSAYAPTTEEGGGVEDLKKKYEQSLIGKYTEREQAVVPGIMSGVTLGLINNLPEQTRKVEQINLDIQEKRTNLDNNMKKLEQLKSRGLVADYNNLAPIVNQKIDDYNTNITSAQKEFSQYMDLPQVKHPVYNLLGEGIGTLASYRIIGKIFAPLVPKITTYMATHAIGGVIQQWSPTLARYIPYALGSGAPLFGTSALLRESIKQFKEGNFDPKNLLLEVGKGTAFGLITAYPDIMESQSKAMLLQAINFGGWTAAETYLKEGKLDKNDIPAILIQTGLGALFEYFKGQDIRDAYKNERLGMEADNLARQHLSLRNPDFSQTEIRNMANTIGATDTALFFARSDLDRAQQQGARPEVIRELQTNYTNLLNRSNYLYVNYFFKEGLDYIIKDGEVILINTNTGRLDPGKTWQKFEPQKNYTIYDGKLKAVEWIEGQAPLMKVGGITPGAMETMNITNEVLSPYNTVQVPGEPPPQYSKAEIISNEIADGISLTDTIKTLSQKVSIGLTIQQVSIAPMGTQIKEAYLQSRIQDIVAHGRLAKTYPKIVEKLKNVDMSGVTTGTEFAEKVKAQLTPEEQQTIAKEIARNVGEINSNIKNVATEPDTAKSFLEPKKAEETITVYHGTEKMNAEIIDRQGMIKQPSKGEPIYLTTNKEVAQQYTGEGGKVYELEVPKSQLKPSNLGEFDYEYKGTELPITKAEARVPENWKQVVPLRDQGLTLEQVGKKLGYSVEKVRQIEVRMRKGVEVPYEKQGRNLMEWEDDDLTLPELKRKLEIAKEGKEDQWLIDQITKDIKQRETKPLKEVKPEVTKPTITPKEVKVTPAEEKAGKEIYQAEYERVQKVGEGKITSDILSLGGLKTDPTLKEEMSDLPIDILRKDGLEPDIMREVLNNKGYDFENTSALFDFIRDIRSMPSRYRPAESALDKKLRMIRAIKTKMPKTKFVTPERLARLERALLRQSTVAPEIEKAMPIRKLVERLVGKEFEVKVKEITPPKPPAPPTFEQPKFSEDAYKKGLIEEIGNLPNLPKIERGVLEWKPNTLGYNNPYTRTAYRLWDRIQKTIDSKAPTYLKKFETKEIGELMREKQRVLDALTKKYLEKFVKPLQKLTPEEKKEIGQMIFKHVEVPAKYKDRVRQIDLHIGQLGKAIVDMDKEMVREGILDPEMALLSEKKWVENLGEYMRTLYIRPNKKDPTKYTIVPKSTLTAEGIIDRSAFKRKMTDAEWGANSLQFEGKTAEEIGEYSIKDLEEIGREAKKGWGWTTQADYVLAKTFKDMAKTYATRLWQAEIVKDKTLFLKTTKLGFISIKQYLPRGIDQDKRLGPLNNGYINPALKDEIQTFLKYGADATERALSRPLGLWKAAKVAMNIRTVVRNFISGATVQTDMAGFPVWAPANAPRYLKSVRDYLIKKGTYINSRDNGQFGGDYYAVEIDEADIEKIISKAEKSGSPLETYAGLLAEKLGSAMDTIRGATRYYGHIDHIQRLYLYNSAIENGATPAQAVHFANKWELDYRFVPKIIEKARSGVSGWFFPFVSFYSSMAPRIMEVAVTRPWVLAKYPIIVALLGMLAAATLGMDEKQIESAKPKWLVGEPYVIPLPWRDSAGNVIFLDLGYTLPFGSWETGFIDWQGVANMAKGGGLMGIMQASLSNYDSFTGKKIYEDADTPDVRRQKIASYVLRSLGPGFVSDALNIYKAAKGEVIGYPYPQERDLTLTLMRALGISTYPGGTNEALSKIRMYTQQINDINFALSIVMKNPNISAEEKQKKVLESREMIIELTKKIKDIGGHMPNAPIKKGEPSSQVPANPKSNLETMVTNMLKKELT